MHEDRLDVLKFVCGKHQKMDRITVQYLNEIEDKFRDIGCEVQRTMLQVEKLIDHQKLLKETYEKQERFKAKHTKS